MKIYNQEKKTILENPDLTKGYLVNDKIFVKHVPAQEEVKKQSHYEDVKVFYNPDGSVKGKEVREVIDIPHRPAVEAHDEYEDIQVYIPYTEEELLEMQKEELRAWREEYFKIIDCAVWYDCLTVEEKEEVKQFRQELLDITTTLKHPAIPNCVLKRV